MTIIIPKEKTSSSDNNNVELEYVEDQQQQQQGVSVVKPSSTANRTIATDDELRRREAADASRESCCTQKCCHYCLAIWCCLILINSLIGVLIRMNALTYSSPRYDYSPQPSMPSAVPTSKPSPSPTIGFSNLPTLSSMPTLENGFRSIANEPGVIQLHRDSDNFNLLSPDIKFPSPMKWSDEHEPVTSMSAYVNGSIRLGCGGEDSWGGGGFCPSITSIVRTQQYLYDSLLVPSYRTNVYALFASEADTTSDGEPFVTISWESDVAYTSYNAQPSIYYHVTWEVKLYTGYVMVCYGPSRIESKYMREVRLSLRDMPPSRDVPNNWVNWYYPGAPLNEDGGEGVSFFPSNQCFSMGPKAP